MNKIIIPVVIIAAIAIVAASITLNMSMDSEMMQDSDMMDSEMMQDSDMMDSEMMQDSDMMDSEMMQDSDMMDSEMMDSEMMQDSDMMDSEMMDSEMMDSEMMDSEMMDSEMMQDSDMMDSEMMDSEMMQDSDMMDSEMTDTMTTSSLSGAVKIGIMLPLTGDLSSHGEENLMGAMFGIKTFNEYLEDAGEDWYLEAITEDTATNPVQALDKIQNLRAKNIELVMGPETSSSTSSVLQYADNNNMIIFSCCSTSPALAIPGDNVFRLVPDDRQQGKALATLLKNEGIENLITVWRGDTYGDGLAENLETSFVSAGGIVTEGIRYNPETPDFSVTASVLANVASLSVAEFGSDKVAIVIIGFAESVQFIQSSSQYEVLNNVRWFGADSLANEFKLVQDPITLEFTQAVNFTAISPGFASTPASEKVKTHIFDALGRYPTTFVETSYDIPWIYGLSILEAQSDRYADIKPILPKIASEHNGAIGEIKLNENGDLESSDYSIYEIDNAEWVVIGNYFRNGTIIFNDQ